MWRRAKLLTGLILLVAPVCPAFGQDSGWIRVDTNEPSAHVYIDSVYVGPASQGFFSAPVGERYLRLAPAERSSWSIDPADTLIQVAIGDTVAVELAFPTYYRVESMPYAATVYVTEAGVRERMGETPLTFHVPTPLERPISLEKSGYVSVEIEPGTARWNRHVVALERAPRTGDKIAGAEEVSWYPPRSLRTSWIDYAAIGVAVVSGVVAVHYKFKADDLYDRYLKTGDPLLEDRIRTFDVRSGIALGAMQVGIGVFAIRLALK